MNKRGQFYILAAIIIVMFLFGISSISTYAVVKPEPRTVYDLSRDLNRESYKVIEYGIFNKKDLKELSESFAGEDVAKYFLKKTESANIVFVYGNKKELEALSYITLNTGSIQAGGGTWENIRPYYKKKKLKPEDFEDGFLKIEIIDNIYYFDLKDNEMFYFVIVKEREGELFVERSEKQKDEKRPGGADRKIKKDRKKNKEGNNKGSSGGGGNRGGGGDGAD